MKLAILLISSYGIDALNACLSQFENDTDIDVYIHSDGNTLNDLNENRTYTATNVKSCEHVYVGRLFSADLLRISWYLLEKAYNSGIDYDYYIIMSDSCRFIKPLNEVKSFFENNTTTYIEAWSRYIDTCFKYADGSCKCSKGSQWITIYKSIVKIILTLKDKFEQYIKEVHDNTIICIGGAIDEFVFNQLIMNDICHFDENLIKKYNIDTYNSIRYAAWNGGDHLEILTMENFLQHKHAITSNTLICRKFDHTNPSSMELLNRLKNGSIMLPL